MGMTSQEASISVETIEGITGGVLLIFEGDLDATNVADALKKIDAVLAQSPSYIIADFKKLRYINSTGLGILLEVTKRAQEISCSFRLCHINSDIQEIIDLVGVTPLLDIFATRDAAIASCN